MSTRFYYSGETVLSPGVLVELDADESRHLLKVMRATVGDPLIVFGRGGQFHATLQEKISANRALISVSDPIESPPGPSIQVTMLVPWIKGGKTEWVIQKLTELGAANIVVFQATREVARGDADKLQRLRRVAVEACKQCERSAVPSVILAGTLAEAVDACSEIPPESRYILHERIQGQRLSQAVREQLTENRPIMLASGPEGGWDPDEIAAVGEGATLVSLGPVILRAETAPVAAMAALLALVGDI